MGRPGNGKAWEWEGLGMGRPGNGKAWGWEGLGMRLGSLAKIGRHAS